MKIAQVVCVYPPYAGGIGVASQKLHNMLKSSEHEAFVFTINKKREEALEKKDPKIIELKPYLRAGHGAFTPSLIKKLKKFDLIYFHYPFFGNTAVIYFFKLLNPRKKLIIHYHMDVNHKNKFFKILSYPERLIRPLLFKRADLVIGASKDYLQNSSIKKYCQKNPEKFEEIPFSVDTEKFKPGKKTGQNTLLFVGGLDRAHYFKGVDILLKSLAQLKDLNWELKIIGTGELKGELSKQSEDLGIKNRVHFLGKMKEDDLIKNYQEARVLILPSINSNEAFGIVLIEALACATPVIASNLPGVRSVFENEKSGLLVKAGSIEDLKNKIKDFLENQDKQKEMSQTAHQRALEFYSERVVAKKTLETLKRVYENRNY